MTAGIPNTVFVTAFAGAAALSFGLTPVVRRAALAFGVLDVPDERKVHTAPVPRLGGAAVGLAMALAVLAALAASPALRSALFGSNGLIRWGALGIALAAVLLAGAVDDVRGLPAGVKLALERGDTVLLGGPSGVGKSTLLRAIAGIWPYGRGTIHLARDARVLFLPQKPYLPLGTLRDVVSYPKPVGGVEDSTLRATLEAVELPGLAGRLDEAAHWALQLSPGEQQRIAFARVLVQKADWLFLDEATSAVDEMMEARLYRLLRERLPRTTVFSVGHRETLRPFHVRQLVVQPNANGPASIVEIAAASVAP